MGVADITVLLAALAATAGPCWYFFAPRHASVAEVSDGVQRIQVTVHVRELPRTSA